MSRYIASIDIYAKLKAGRVIRWLGQDGIEGSLEETNITKDIHDAIGDDDLFTEKLAIRYKRRFEGKAVVDLAKEMVKETELINNGDTAVKSSGIIRRSILNNFKPHIPWIDLAEGRLLSEVIEVDIWTVITISAFMNTDNHTFTFPEIGHTFTIDPEIPLSLPASYIDQLEVNEVNATYILAYKSIDVQMSSIYYTDISGDAVRVELRTDDSLKPNTISVHLLPARGFTLQRGIAKKFNLTVSDVQKGTMIGRLSVSATRDQIESVEDSFIRGVKKDAIAEYKETQEDNIKFERELKLKQLQQDLDAKKEKHEQAQAFNVDEFRMSVMKDMADLITKERQSALKEEQELEKYRMESQKRYRDDYYDTRKSERDNDGNLLKFVVGVGMFALGAFAARK